MHILLFGASRNIGYAVAQRLLAKGHICTFLLRRPEAMESDASMTTYIKDGKAKIIHGDGLVEADPRDGEIDYIFFGIGGEPSLSLLKGAVITPHDLTSRSMGYS
ncbi:hypothetical protein RhiLY_08284 [Ceratobasidium sp. AG-Ba]|nr:hypothetical protein RhiLY_08284 [Ceratobasidium sp. AG-Ba]